MRLDSQVRALAQMKLNLNQEQGYLQTASGALEGQLEILQKIRDIASQASNGVLSVGDRKSLQSQLQSLLSDYDRISNETEFNGIKPLQNISGVDTRSNSVFREEVFRGSFSSFDIDSTYVGESGDALDADGDGDTDIALIHSTNSSEVVFQLNNGAGSFTTLKTFSVGAAISSLKARDINEDGREDLLVSTATNLFLYQNNGDGLNDVAIGNSGSTNITFYLGDGTGVLRNRSTLAVNSSFNSFQIDSGDFNGDGKLDLIAVGEFSNIGPPAHFGRSAFTYFGDGTGSFTEASTYIALNISSSNHVIKDFNHDGLDDLGDSGYIYLSQGNGRYASSIVPASYDVLFSPLNLYEDFNGDGIVDLRSYNSDSAYWMTVFGQSHSENRRSAVNVFSAENAQNLLSLVDNAIETLQSAISKVGVMENNLDTTRNSHETLQESLSSARDDLSAVDYAQNMAELV